MEAALNEHPQFTTTIDGANVRRYAEQGNNIVHWTEFDRGGHFAAMEAPGPLVGDVRAIG